MLTPKFGDVVEQQIKYLLLRVLLRTIQTSKMLNRRAEKHPTKKRKSFLRIGPGLITGVADDDPSGIGTYSVAGAMFGYQLYGWLPSACRL